MLHTPSLTPPLSNPNASGLARRASNNFATALAAPLIQGGQIMSLTPGATTALSSDTAVTLVIDPGLANQEVVIGWVNGDTIVNMARGCEGSNGPHAQGAIVMSYQTAQDQNSIVDFLLTDHTPDGHHHPAFLVGEIRQWPVTSLPDSNWLVCDGSSLLQTAYPDLFAVLGTHYGSADTTHFNLPDYRGKTLVGQDTGQAEFAQIGQVGGEKTHILLTNEMPSHTHAHNAHNHNLNDPGHTHPVSDSGGFGAGPGNGGLFREDQNSPATIWSNGIARTAGTNISLGAATTTENPAGGDAAHNNLQPYAVANMIIRALA